MTEHMIFNVLKNCILHCSKRPKSGNRTVPKNYVNNPIQHEKLSPGSGKVENPVFHTQQEGTPYHTATVKSMYAYSVHSKHVFLYCVEIVSL